MSQRRFRFTPVFTRVMVICEYSLETVAMPRPHAQNGG
jgi:hypothetical protein